MKTIEERAREYAPGTSNSDSLFPTRISTLAAIERRGYIAGATEQKAIDIDKTCEWLKNNWREYVNQDRDGMILFGHWESDFRKAMEEKDGQD